MGFVRDVPYKQVFSTHQNYPGRVNFGSQIRLRPGTDNRRGEEGSAMFFSRGKGVKKNTIEWLDNDRTFYDTITSPLSPPHPNPPHRIHLLYHAILKQRTVLFNWRDHHEISCRSVKLNFSNRQMRLLPREITNGHLPNSSISIVFLSGNSSFPVFSLFSPRQKTPRIFPLLSLPPENWGTEKRGR